MFPTTDLLFSGVYNLAVSKLLWEKFEVRSFSLKAIFYSNFIFKNRDLLLLCYISIFKGENMPQLLMCHAKLAFLGDKMYCVWADLLVIVALYLRFSYMSKVSLSRPWSLLWLLPLRHNILLSGNSSW